MKIKNFLLLFVALMAIVAVNAQDWMPLGPNDFNQVSYNQASFTKIAIGPGDIPYAVYRDLSNGNKATVVKYVGGTWSIVGTRGFTASSIEYADIAISSDGIPYVVIQTDAGAGTDLLNATVYRFASGSWVIEGESVVGQQYSFNSYSVAIPSVAIAISPDNVPYVAFADYNDPNLPLAATVKRFNGVSWSNVGNPGFTGASPYFAQAISLDFSISPDGTPYFLFTDNSPNLSITNSATLMLFNGTQWVLAGQQGFSNAEISSPSLCISQDGTPFVAYKDITHSNKATVKKFDGLNWENVGAMAFSDGEIDNLSLAVSSENLPVVIYKDLANSNRATVKMFDGLNWNTLGSADFSNGTIQFPHISISSTDIPYVIYQDASSQLKATVKKFDIEWQSVGKAGLSGRGASYVAGAASTASNKVYAAFRDAKSGKATVMFYENSDWELAGSADFTAGSAENIAIAISPLDQTPFIAYRDGANGGKLTVNYLALDGWALVGTDGFTPGAVNFVSLAVSSNGIPYVAFNDISNGDKLTVMSFNGAEWVIVGTAGFSSGVVSELSLKLTSDNIPYIAYFDHTNNRATAKRFTGGSWENVGPGSGFSIDIANDISLAFNSAHTPIVAYQNGNGGSATVKTFDGTNWVDLGSTNISGSAASYISLNVGTDNIPVIAYRDESVQNRITVKSFQSGVWSLVGTQGFNAGAASDVSLLFTSDNKPRIIYGDGYVWARIYTDFVPVPVTLLGFDAIKEDRNVRLKWYTSIEVNNDYFTLEHSADGRNFVQIARIAAQNNPVAIQNYSFLHQQPVSGFNYYRLKQVDYDGKITVYPVRSVKLGSSILFAIYPNPAGNKINLKAKIQNGDIIEIFQLNGQLIYRKMLSSAYEDFSIDLTNFKSGAYMLRLSSGISYQTVNFIKQ